MSLRVQYAPLLSTLETSLHEILWFPLSGTFGKSAVTCDLFQNMEMWAHIKVSITEGIAMRINIFDLHC
jgi:hypothetical protein